MDPTTLAIVLTFSIPIIAIIGGLYMEWLKMRAKQKTLGAANRELEQTVEELKRSNADQARRLENLETIVVSQTWSVLHTAGAAGAERPQRTAVAPHETQAPAAEELNRQRAELLARRLGG
jgi:hypothetical protein